MGIQRPPRPFAESADAQACAARAEPWPSSLTMILGLGSDICDIRRIEHVLERFGARFIDRVFTEAERRRAERRNGRNRAGTYAKRFAAKEACAKALGTGFARGVFMSDLGVVNLPSGQPTLRLEGGAAERLAQASGARRPWRRGSI